AMALLVVRSTLHTATPSSDFSERAQKILEEHERTHHEGSSNTRPPDEVVRPNTVDSDSADAERPNRLNGADSDPPFPSERAQKIPDEHGERARHEGSSANLLSPDKFVGPQADSDSADAELLNRPNGADSDSPNPSSRSAGGSDNPPPS